MSAYRLAALDMDGTLLNSEHETSAYTRAVIDRAAKAGKIVALSTGRALSELWAHLAVNPGISYIIGESGACVYDVKAGRTLRMLAIEDGIVDAILELSERSDALRQCFIKGQSYMTGGTDEALAAHHLADFATVYRAGSRFVKDIAPLCRENRGEVSKLNLFFAEAAERERCRARLTGMNVEIKDSVGLGLEISAPGVDKGRGLRFLCEYLDIPLAQAMAVGDGDNDLDIMGTAGLSVAMGNAIDEVRALADAITDDCDHDGAARAIERYLLNA